MICVFLFFTKYSNTVDVGYGNISVLWTYFATPKCVFLSDIHSIVYAGYKNIIGEEFVRVTINRLLRNQIGMWPVLTSVSRTSRAVVYSYFKKWGTVI